MGWFYAFPKMLQGSARGHFYFTVFLRSAWCYLCWVSLIEAGNWFDLLIEKKQVILIYDQHTSWSQNTGKMYEQHPEKKLWAGILETKHGKQIISKHRTLYVPSKPELKTYHYHRKNPDSKLRGVVTGLIVRRPLLYADDGHGRSDSIDQEN